MGNIKSFSDFISMYVDGFKNLTWGRVLWIIIIVKLFIMFAILKPVFFPNVLNQRFETEEEKTEYILDKLTDKSNIHSKKNANESD